MLERVTIPDVLLCEIIGVRTIVYLAPMSMECYMLAADILFFVICVLILVLVIIAKELYKSTIRTTVRLPELVFYTVILLILVHAIPLLVVCFSSEIRHYIYLKYEKIDTYISMPNCPYCNDSGPHYVRPFGLGHDDIITLECRACGNTWHMKPLKVEKKAPILKKQEK